MKHFFILSLLLTISLSVFGQFDNEFWFAAPYDTPGHDATNQYRFVMTTADEAATVTISIPANTGFTPVNLTIPANSTQIYNFSTPTDYSDLIICHPSNQTHNKGIKLVATTKIFCYYEITSASSNNTDMFSLKGKSALGLNFYIPLQTHFNNGDYTPISYSAFLILATEDNTQVTITPTQALVGHAANVPFTITLQRGQVYVAEASSRMAAGHPAGSKVTATKNIVITVTDDSMQFSSSLDIGGDQIVPVDKLGTIYVPVRGFVSSPYDPVFIVATEDNTTVSINGTAATTLDEGDSYEYLMGNVAGCFIQTNLPVYVSQVSGFGTELGFSLLPSIECRGSRSVSVSRSTSMGFYLCIVTLAGNESSFTFNGATNVITAADFSDVPGTFGIYKCVRKEITASQLAVGSSATIANSQGDFQLGVVHGAASGTCRFSYFSDFAEQQVQYEGYDTVCQGDTLSLQIIDDLEGNVFTWISANDTFTGRELIIPNVQPEYSGLYVVEGSIGSCPLSACSLYVYIKPSPSAEFEYNDNCMNEPTPFIPNNEEGGNFFWNFGDGSSSSVITPTHTYTDMGDFTVMLAVETENGCVDTVTHTITIAPIITRYDSATICKGVSYPFYGAMVTTAGDYEHLVDAEGCDTMVYLHIEVNSGQLSIAQSPQNFCDNSDAFLTATSSYATFLWSTGETAESIYVNAPGTYSVTASQDGCEIVRQHYIAPCKYVIYLPNAISPSRADGINDYFALQEMIIPNIDFFEIYIYNRFGEQVFFSNRPSFKWDGRVNGKQISHSIFTYVIKVRFKEETDLEEIKGSITVL